MHDMMHNFLNKAFRGACFCMVHTCTKSVYKAHEKSCTRISNSFSPGATIDLTSEEPKIKRRRIKHDALFRAEKIQKKEEGATTAELINIYKSFNLDKTKVSK